jgi:DNA-directed RNA polymerase, mitochondrial
MSLSANDIERQLKIEADSRRDGLERYLKAQAYRSASDSRPVRDFMGMVLNPLADAILAEQLLLKKAKGQKLPKHALPLLCLRPDLHALITLGTLFNAISKSELENEAPPPLTPVGYAIGEFCRRERRYDCVRKRQIDVARELLLRNQGRNALQRAIDMARPVDDDADWEKNYRSYHLGEKLIALAIRYAWFEGHPVFEVKTVRERDGRSTKTLQLIALTAAAADWIDAHQPDLALLATPVYEPMVIPPRPFISLSDGGYYSERLTLLKRRPNRQAQQLLEKADLSIVYAAVNAMQSTPFRINQYLYRIMRRALEERRPFFGLKSGKGAKARKRILSVLLSRAEWLSKEPRFYFPHQIDHRARAYPVPQLTNPQSDDNGRCLLEFADGKPLGECGAYWLAVQIANCFGLDKVSFAERRAWVKQNEEEIIAFANDPLNPHRFWEEADNPGMFLAACHEWKRYKEEGPDFLSHLPVSMDGTCNGYQHLSALSRDPLGGRATNLVVADKPMDIYQDVCDEASARIARDAAGHGPDRDAALELLGKLSRSDAKHATMTTPYGVTRGRIYKELLKRPVIQSCKDPEKCARYLAKVLQEAIPKVAVEAGKIMKWLRQVARILGNKNRGMEWITPTGFWVIHATRKPKPVRVATANHTLKLHQEDETRKIDPRKMADGVVAHLVHSLDASHMMRTIHRLVGEGICHFAMVHDSFGVHACDIDRLHRVLREEFVAIHSEPVLENFLNDLRKAHPRLDFPDLPPAGNLDIHQVLESPYFFA